MSLSSSFLSCCISAFDYRNTRRQSNALASSLMYGTAGTLNCFSNGIAGTCMDIVFVCASFVQLGVPGSASFVATTAIYLTSTYRMNCIAVALALFFSARFFVILGLIITKDAKVNAKYPIKQKTIKRKKDTICCCSKSECACKLDTECPICLEIKGKHTCTLKLVCGHSFHVKCLEMWVNHGSTCPMCRKSFTLNYAYHSNRWIVAAL